MKKHKLKEENFFDMEARWRGTLEPQERQDVKNWEKKTGAFAFCNFKIGKERSRLTIKFDREKIEEKARQEMSVVEALLRGQSQQGEIDSEAANIIAHLKLANTNSSEGLLLKDYIEVIANDWALKSSTTLQALIPTRCGLKVILSKKSEKR